MIHGEYRAADTYDYDAGVFHGDVIDTRDVITFQAASVAELRQAFRDSVDEYLKVCTERGRNSGQAASAR